MYELNQVYLAKQEINAAIQESGLPGNVVQLLNDEWQWSGSTVEDKEKVAHIQHFGDGDKESDYKSWGRCCDVRFVLSLACKSRS